jgi:hypothetical protein
LLSTTRLSGAQNAQARPGLQEDVDDHQIALLPGVGEPADRARLVDRRADNLDRCEFFEGGNQVFADHRAVFDNEGFERGHGLPDFWTAWAARR